MAQLPQPWPTTRSADGLSHARSNPFPTSAKPNEPDSRLAEDRSFAAQVPGGQDPAILFLRLTESARGLTGASAAALACLREGAIRCEARSGSLAPPLGAILDGNSGISGECLRLRKPVRCRDTESDERVNREVCRELGLRSLAAVPILEAGGSVGLLEVFSDHPNAFTTEHLDILTELAGLAASARRSSVATVDTPPKEEEVQQARLQAVREAIASAAPNPQSHTSLRKWLPLAVSALVLTVGAAVVGWRYGMFTAGDASGVSASPPAETSSQTPPSPASQIPALSVQDTKPSATRPGADRALGVEPAAAKQGAADGAAPRLVAGGRLPQTDAPADPALPAPDLSGTGVASTSTLSGILEPSTDMPSLTLPISQGVTGGRLRKRVNPDYPAMAKSIGMEGAVVLEATVTKEGTVENVKIVSGPPVLAAAAMAAVRQWRYEPFLLNNQPVPVQTSIQIQFKMPR